jgi:hypothetical protein
MRWPPLAQQSTLRSTSASTTISPAASNELLPGGPLPGCSDLAAGHKHISKAVKSGGGADDAPAPGIRMDWAC